MTGLYGGSQEKQLDIFFDELKRVSKKSLKIEEIHSANSSWFVEGTQIDLVIRRANNWINLYENEVSQFPI